MAKKLTDSPTDYQFSNLELSLDKIKGLHPSLVDITALSSNMEYLLESGREIDQNHFSQFLQFHPFIVIEEENNFYCINNPRLFQIANLIFPNDYLLNCRLIQNYAPAFITKMGQTDFFLSHLLFSLRPQDADDQICRVWKGLDSEFKNAILPEAKHQNLLAKLLKTSRNQTYLRRKRSNKSNDDVSTD